ncbi:MAG: protealysin inhibitor emfourin, partial [Planctomycetia bacterium]
MLITFTQSGGFAGLVKGCRIDTAELEKDERNHVEGLVEATGWRESWERFSAGRDRLQYDVTIERDASVLHVTCDDRSLPAPARPLVAWLRERARPQRLN